tara:strand:- start:5971 stop:6435 length:465 start_codon:yes stop_codon:yes gene_type:complete
MEYYTSNDLLKRRADIALWMCSQTKKISNHYNYGELLSQKYIMNLEYLSGAMDAMSCYDPVSSELEDGVINCLKESQLDKLFNNVSNITGLCWQPKGITYVNQINQSIEAGEITDTAGDPISTTSGNGVIGITIPDLGDTNTGATAVVITPIGS